MIRLALLFISVLLPLSLHAQSCDEVVCIQGFTCDESTGEPSNPITGEVISSNSGYCGLQQRLACKLTFVGELQDQLAELRGRSITKERVIRRLRRRLRLRRR